MKLEIQQDANPTSPLDWADGNLFLVGKHRDFFVPPLGGSRSFDVAAVITEHTKTHHVFALEAYIHDGVVLALANTGNFPDRQWDVSLVGAVFVAKKEWRVGVRARLAAMALVNEWNQYLAGDVWGAVVSDDDGKQVDSCWGFYGRKYAEEQGAEMLAAAQAAAVETETATTACLI